MVYISIHQLSRFILCNLYTLFANHRCNILGYLYSIGIVRTSSVCIENQQNRVYWMQLTLYYNCFVLSQWLLTVIIACIYGCESVWKLDLCFIFWKLSTSTSGSQLQQVRLYSIKYRVCYVQRTHYLYLFHSGWSRYTNIQHV